MRRAVIVSGMLFLVAGIYLAASGTQREEGDGIDGAASIVVLASGNLALGVADRNEVVLYSPKGEFLFGVPCDSGRGGIRLRAIPSGGFQAATVRNRRLYTFDAEGSLLSRQDGFDGYESFSPHGQWEARSADGSIYLLQEGRILRRSGSAEDVLVGPGPSTLIGEPLLQALLILSGCLQLGAAIFGWGVVGPFVIRAARTKQPSWLENPR